MKKNRARERARVNPLVRCHLGTVDTRTRARAAAQRVAVGSPADGDVPLTSRHRGSRTPSRTSNPSRALVSSRAMTKYESLSISHRRGRLVRDDRGGARNAKLPNGGFVVGEDGFLRPARPDGGADPAVGDVDADADADADASETVCAARRDAEAAAAAAAAKTRAETPEETRARLAEESVATARGVADAISYAARGGERADGDDGGRKRSAGGVEGCARRAKRRGVASAYDALGDVPSDTESDEDEGEE